MLASQLTTYQATLWSTAYRPEEKGHQQTSNNPIKRKEKQKTHGKLWVCQKSACYSFKQNVLHLCEQTLCLLITYSHTAEREILSSLPPEQYLHWGDRNFCILQTNSAENTSRNSAGGFGVGVLSNRTPQQ